MFRQEKDMQQDDADLILEVQNVSAGYTQNSRVVEKINLKVARWKTIALAGESGSGKTSLARVITALLSPSTSFLIRLARSLR